MEASWELQPGALGNAIRQARIEQNLSQEALAELVEITPTHLKHIESEHRKPSVEVLFRLVHVLHFSLDSLFAEENAQKQKLLHTADLLLSQCDEKQLRFAVTMLHAMLES